MEIEETIDEKKKRNNEEKKCVDAMRECGYIGIRLQKCGHFTFC